MRSGRTSPYLAVRSLQVRSAMAQEPDSLKSMSSTIVMRRQSASGETKRQRGRARPRRGASPRR